MPVASTSIADISKALAVLLRDNLFDGRELALIEPVNGPRPAYTYCSIGYIRALQFEREVKKFDIRDNVLYERLRGTRYLRYRLTFRGVGAYQLSIDCQNLLNSTFGDQWSISPIAGFGKIWESQEITTEVLGIQEEAAFFNLDLYAKLSAEYPWYNTDVVVGSIYRDGVDVVPIEIARDNKP